MADEETPQPAEEQPQPAGGEEAPPAEPQAGEETAAAEIEATPAGEEAEAKNNNAEADAKEGEANDAAEETPAADSNQSAAQEVEANDDTPAAEPAEQQATEGEAGNENEVTPAAETEEQQATEEDAGKDVEATPAAEAEEKPATEEEASKDAEATPAAEPEEKQATEEEEEASKDVEATPAAEAEEKPATEEEASKDAEATPAAEPEEKQAAEEEASKDVEATPAAEPEEKQATEEETSKDAEATPAAEAEEKPATEEEASKDVEATPAAEPEEKQATEEDPKKEDEAAPAPAPAEAEEKPATQEAEATAAKEEPPAAKQEEQPPPQEKPKEEAKPVKREPSPPAAPLVNLEATATVKFVLMPSGQVVTMACTLGQTLHMLKNQFAAELKMPANMILLMFDGKTMSDSATLADLGVGPNGTVQLEMQSADPVNNPIRSYRPRHEYQMPDVITVRVTTDGDEAKDVVVEIERATNKKPFLGGFRHKVSGKEFHNASAQTIQKVRIGSGVERFCRDTQTVQQIHRVQQTFNDTSTQMTGVGVYVSNIEDKLLEPGKYTLADDHLYMILQKVILIQKYYRRWLAKRYVNSLKEDKRRRLEWERQEELRRQKEKEDRIKREFERRMHPKTKEDFDLLYSALEKWRLEELERINSTLTGAERKAALCMLLDQETQLLAAIDRHKLETGTDNRQQRIQDFLDKAAAPKKWRGFDGKPTEMDTPYTLRAKELRDIYNSINMKYLTQDERLDVLLTLKHTVKEHDCKLTQEIIELIDREADLLMRGVKEGNLTGLRKRISTLFLQYIKTPTFNPEAAKLLKVPQDPSTLRRNIYFCFSCERYLPSTEFNLTSNSRNPGRCRSCIKVDNDARIRQDFSHYRRMLKALRLSEENYNDGSQIAFLMQENDLRYLVENIWSGQSVLSAWEDLYDLMLVRWDRHTQWSPWNCILLTVDEAKAHDKLVSLDEGYGEVFIHKVKQKHTLARNYFSRLPGMAELIRQHGGHDGSRSMPGPSSITGQSMNVPQKV